MYFVDSQSKSTYNKENPIKFMADVIKSSLWRYSDAKTLVIGDITVAGDNAKTKIAFKTIYDLR